MNVAANFFSEILDDKVRCELCPHLCHISPNNYGNCRVRKNVNGKLISENYGKLSAVHLDPIEKKPLYHFYPGSKILSLGSVGCNFHCNFCQNSDISQTGVENFAHLQSYTKEEIIAKASAITENIGIAYTYNEPIVWYEFMLDVAVATKKTHLKNVVVSNGYINPKPLEKLMPYVDAFNIDLKAFNDNFYKQLVGGHLEPVKQSLIKIKKFGCHLEITNLIIPSKNDDEREFAEMINWIANELGQDTVLHLSRYFPRYKSNLTATPEATIYKLYAIAKEKLDFVYIGNMPSEKGTNTVCPKCGKTLVFRNSYHIFADGLDENACCKYCLENMNFIL